jgi:hypothetical protein
MRHDDVWACFDYVRETAAKAFDLSLCPAGVDDDVVARDVAQFAQAVHEGIHEMLVGGSRAGFDKADTVNGLRLLRSSCARGDE